MLEVQELESGLYIEGIERQLCPYIDLAELEEAIVLYYKGELNFVSEEHYGRLYMDAKDLIPGKTLLSVLDGSTMWECIYQLDPIHRCVLNSYFGDSVVANVQLSKAVPPGMWLIAYQSYLLPHAINELAYIVHELL